jgi:hypothetical protein
VLVEMLEGDQVPVIPLFDVPGNEGETSFKQKVEGIINVGLI